MRRYLLSDIANQAPILQAQLQREGSDKGAVSMIGQPPLDGSKIALWIYMVEGLEVSYAENLTTTSHNGYRHYWSTNWQSTTGGSNTQTREILEGYEAQLRHADLNLADNCLRTWFFIRDVDTNYKGMVEARCNNFTMQHLTPDTHYIASTGIGGQPIQTQSRVQMDAYAAQGLRPEQQRYLYAPTHLNPTYQYGVTFERGTAIQYGDRRHLIISGTASIDHRGHVLHEGDVVAQTDRLLENIEVLLREGGSDFGHVPYFVIYLRDISDYRVIDAYMQERFPSIPRIILEARVCRPAWLIEMECETI
jgi:enamine deaminase RidA (YjgF/YER057c/UK114 family)